MSKHVQPMGTFVSKVKKRVLVNLLVGGLVYTSTVQYRQVPNLSFVAIIWIIFSRSPNVHLITAYLFFSMSRSGTRYTSEPNRYARASWCHHVCILT